MRKLLFGLLVVVFFLPSALLAAPTGSPTLWEKAAYGEIPGLQYVRLHGYNGGITTTFEPIWAETNAYTVLTAALSSPYCASTDTADDSGSTGCESITITGVDTSYTAFTENLVMDGRTSVNITTANVLFINSIRCTGAGSGFINAGAIACGTGTNTNGDPAVVHQLALAGQGISQSAMYAVPANSKLICRNPYASVYAITASSLYRIVADWYPDPITDKYFNRIELINMTAPAASSGYVSATGGMIVFPAKSIVLIQALASTGTGPLTFSMECLQVSDTWKDSAQDIF